MRCTPASGQVPALCRGVRCAYLACSWSTLAFCQAVSGDSFLLADTEGRPAHKLQSNLPDCTARSYWLRSSDLPPRILKLGYYDFRRELVSSSEKSTSSLL